MSRAIQAIHKRKTQESEPRKRERENQQNRIESDGLLYSSLSGRAFLIISTNLQNITHNTRILYIIRAFLDLHLPVSLSPLSTSLNIVYRAFDALVRVQLCRIFSTLYQVRATSLVAALFA